jgi:hypothetical protein
VVGNRLVLEKKIRGECLPYAVDQRRALDACLTMLRAAL